MQLRVKIHGSEKHRPLDLEVLLQEAEKSKTLASGFINQLIGLQGSKPSVQPARDAVFATPEQKRSGGALLQAFLDHGAEALAADPFMARCYKRSLDGKRGLDTLLEGASRRGDTEIRVEHPRERQVYGRRQAMAMGLGGFAGASMTYIGGLAALLNGAGLVIHSSADPAMPPWQRAEHEMRKDRLEKHATRGAAAAGAGYVLLDLAEEMPEQRVLAKAVLGELNRVMIHHQAALHQRSGVA